MGNTKGEISNQLDKACNLIQSLADEKLDWITTYLSPLTKERILDDCFIVAKLAKNQEAKILEMGSAPFYTALTLKKMGYDLICTDINPDRFGSLLEKINLEVIQCDFEKEKLPFADNSFDVILLSEVFEHLRIDLIFTTSEIRRVLKPGGKLILSSPNFFEYRRFKKLFFKGKTSDIYNAYHKLQDIGHMGHAREYTRNDVILFLEKMKFDIHDSFYRGIDPKRQNGSSQITIHYAQRLFPFLRRWFVVIGLKPFDR